MSDIHQNIQDIAYCDLKDEKNYVWISNEGMEAMKVMQLGMQYLLNVQRKMTEKVHQVNAYKESQREQLEKLMDIQAEQKVKMHRYKKLDLKLNEQAVHFEIMLNQMNKQVLKDRVNQSEDMSGAADHIFSDKNVFNRVL